MKKFRCANCEFLSEFDKAPKKFICQKCGVLNTPALENAGTGDQAAGCLLPTGFEWKLPVGRIKTPTHELYITPDDGTQLTRLEWIEIFGYDPKIVWEKMRESNTGRPEWVKNLSTLGRRRK